MLRHADRDHLTEDQIAGVRILMRALEEPTRVIAFNARGLQGPLVVGGITKRGAWEGYDFREGGYYEMNDRGIIDPLKVIRSAVAVAVSVGGSILTSGSLITDGAVLEDPYLPADGANGIESPCLPRGSLDIGYYGRQSAS